MSSERPISSNKAMDNLPVSIPDVAATCIWSFLKPREAYNAAISMHSVLQTKSLKPRIDFNLVLMSSKSSIGLRCFSNISRSWSPPEQSIGDICNVDNLLCSYEESAGVTRFDLQCFKHAHPNHNLKTLIIDICKDENRDDLCSNILKHVEAIQDDMLSITNMVFVFLKTTLFHFSIRNSTELVPVMRLLLTDFATCKSWEITGFSEIFTNRSYNLRSFLKQIYAKLVNERDATYFAQDCKENRSKVSWIISPENIVDVNRLADVPERFARYFDTGTEYDIDQASRTALESDVEKYKNSLNFSDNQMIRQIWMEFDAQVVTLSLPKVIRDHHNAILAHPLKHLHIRCRKMEKFDLSELNTGAFVNLRNVSLSANRVVGTLTADRVESLRILKIENLDDQAVLDFSGASYHLYLLSLTNCSGTVNMPKAPKVLNIDRGIIMEKAYDLLINMKAMRLVYQKDNEELRRAFIRMKEEAEYNSPFGKSMSDLTLYGESWWDRSSLLRIVDPGCLTRLTIKNATVKLHGDELPHLRFLHCKNSNIHFHSAFPNLKTLILTSVILQRQWVLSARNLETLLIRNVTGASTLTVDADSAPKLSRFELSPNENISSVIAQIICLRMKPGKFNLSDWLENVRTMKIGPYLKTNFLNEIRFKKVSCLEAMLSYDQCYSLPTTPLVCVDIAISLYSTYLNNNESYKTFVMPPMPNVKKLMLNFGKMPFRLVHDMPQLTDLTVSNRIRFKHMGRCPNLQFIKFIGPASSQFVNKYSDESYYTKIHLFPSWIFITSINFMKKMNYSQPDALVHIPLVSNEIDIAMHSAPILCRSDEFSSSSTSSTSSRHLNNNTPVTRNHDVVSSTGDIEEPAASLSSESGDFESDVSGGSDEGEIDREDNFLRCRERNDLRWEVMAFERMEEKIDDDETQYVSNEAGYVHDDFLSRASQTAHSEDTRTGDIFLVNNEPMPPEIISQNNFNCAWLGWD